MSNDSAHNMFYTKVQHAFVGLSQLETLKQCFSNYRNNKGLRLRKDAFLLLKKLKLYKFIAIEKPRNFDSKYIAFLDNNTTTPFYITTRTIYITDIDTIFDLSMASDDFDIFIDMYK